MSNFIDINNIANANVNDKVEIANQVRIKSSNGMWSRPLAEQTAFITLETNILGGAVETDSFKDVEDKFNVLDTKIYKKDEVDTLISTNLEVIDCGVLV